MKNRTNKKLFYQTDLSWNIICFGFGIIVGGGIIGLALRLVLFGGK